MAGSNLRAKLLKFLHRPRVRAIAPLRLIWYLELSDEISFWDNWMKTRGSNWPLGFESRLDPDHKLQSILSDNIDVPDDLDVEILDVASGPMTWIGRRWGQRVVNVTAVDVLAPHYDRLLAKHGITPLVRTDYATVEELSRFVPADHYDLVFIKNALDHSRDPMKGIEEMLKVVKQGSNVVLFHERNEADKRGGGQLHNWNFNLDDNGRFTITMLGGSATDVSNELGAKATVESRVIDGEEPSSAILTVIRRL